MCCSRELTAASLAACPSCTGDGRPTGARRNGVPRGGAALRVRPARTPSARARLISTLALPLYRAGRMATVEEWFDRLELPVDEYPAAGVVRDVAARLRGRPAEAERWLGRRVERSTYDRPCPTAPVDPGPGLRCSAPSRARRGSSGCVPTPSSPSRSSRRSARGGQPRCCCSGSRFLLEGDCEPRTLSSRNRGAGGEPMERLRAGGRPLRACVDRAGEGRHAAAAQLRARGACDRRRRPAQRLRVDRDPPGRQRARRTPPGRSHAAPGTISYGTASTSAADARRSRGTPSRRCLELARAQLALADPARRGHAARPRRGGDARRPCLGVLVGQVAELRRQLASYGAEHVRVGVEPDRRRAAPAPAALDAPDLPRDRRAVVRLTQHREDASDLDLSQARRLEPRRGGVPRRRSWACVESASPACPRDFTLSG